MRLAWRLGIDSGLARTAVTLAVASALGLVAGCGGGTSASAGPKQVPDATSAPEQKGGEGAEADGDTPARPADPSVDPNELLKPPAAATSAEPTAPPSPAASFDVDRWVRDQGVVAELEVESCELASFPAAKGKAIWCERIEENAAEGIATTVRSVYVPRDQKLAKLADVPVAAGLLDLATSSTATADRYWVKLEAHAAPDGSSVSFTDVAALSCDLARAKNAEFGAYVPDQAARRAKAIDLVCAARGRYGWSAGKLRKLSGQAR